MTLQELTQLASLGEGHNLEFKRRVPQPERIVKELTAFANTHGGRLLLGVDDDGTIRGVRDAEEEEFALRRALAQHCVPPIQYSTVRVSVTNKREVIVVRIPESADKPHFVVNGDPNGRTAYVRVDDKSIEASREAIVLMREKSATNGVTFEFGDKELMLMRYLDQYGRITVQQFAMLAHVSERQASRVLVQLVMANVLRLHADPKQDYFTLAY
jgi:predicted HTH transcriptional regulator